MADVRDDQMSQDDWTGSHGLNGSLFLLIAAERGRITTTVGIGSVPMSTPRERVQGNVRAQRFPFWAWPGSRLKGG